VAITEAVGAVILTPTAHLHTYWRYFRSVQPNITTTTREDLPILLHATRAIAIAPRPRAVRVAPWLAVTLTCARGIICHSFVGKRKHAGRSAFVVRKAVRVGPTRSPRTAVLRLLYVLIRVANTFDASLPAGGACRTKAPRSIHPRTTCLLHHRGNATALNACKIYASLELAIATIGPIPSPAVHYVPKVNSTFGTIADSHDCMTTNYVTTGGAVDGVAGPVLRKKIRVNGEGYRKGPVAKQLLLHVYRAGHAVVAAYSVRLQVATPLTGASLGIPREPPARRGVCVVTGQGCTTHFPLLKSR